MSARTPSIGRGHTLGVWPLLAVTALAVAVPTACILYFLNAAVRNERLAVRQRLADVYRQRAAEAQRLLDARWDETGLAIEAKAQSLPATQAFAEVVRSKLADCVMIPGFGERPGYPPATVTATGKAASDARLAEALDSERQELPPLDAAAKFAFAAKETTDSAVTVRAIVGRARCLARAGDAAGAFEALKEMTDDSARRDTLASARDERGDILFWNAVLACLEYAPDRTTPEFAAVGKLLRARLADYSGETMPCAQRRFLIRALGGLSPEDVDERLKTLLAAEDVAADYLGSTVASPSPGALVEAKPGLYQLASSDGRLVALFTGDSVQSRAARWLADRGLDAPAVGASVALLPPAAQASEGSFLSLPAGQHMPGWVLAVRLSGEDPFGEAAGRQVAVYLWTGAIAVFAVALLAALVVRYISRQARLARLKNDLVATVSHELKTPLASMRVLVDTLVEGRVSGDAQSKEYLGLISRENERLTHLIDNFLTFSRMERNKRAFEPARVSVSDVVDAAVRLVRDRCTTPECTLAVSVADDIPPITADRDAIVTVLLNLLDNAVKYTGDRKEISVRACVNAGHVRIEVTDNGVGISPRDRKRIFDRFYQVDQSLSRRAGGCGLGLAIVKYIVDAHDGTIDVESVPGKGSIFRVTLPLDPKDEAV